MIKITMIKDITRPISLPLKLSRIIASVTTRHAAAPKPWTTRPINIIEKLVDKLEIKLPTKKIPIPK